jgi:hypothetical protein
MIIFEINEISAKDKKIALRKEFQNLMTKLPFRVRLKEHIITYKTI